MFFHKELYAKRVVRACIRRRRLVQMDRKVILILLYFVEVSFYSNFNISIESFILTTKWSFCPHTGSQPAQWTDSLPDGVLKYACANDSVTLAWNYSLSAGESLEDVQWFYEGRSHEMIAVLTHGNFLPLPAFSHRVQYVSGAGITLTQVTVADSGNYSVEISVYKGNSFFHLRRSVILQIGGLSV